ncbi:TetR family transcriptional regulator [Nocardia sp. NPDC052278]|uniref:TetR family transcriptional regulator n=1 Tax=unclassified Nocardia TaxID=2637762 RepID=UPI0036C8409B
MPPSDSVPVRERARRAIRAEVTVLAQGLFAANGYDRTTVDDIAAAAGMHRRTFFRYFTSKEDLVLAKYEVLGDRLTEAFTARPPEEPLWQALRRSFDLVAGYYDDETKRSGALAMERTIRDNPALTAGELERISRIQRQLTEAVRLRSGRADPLDPEPEAVVGAALSCLIAAKAAWAQPNQRRRFADLLDSAMAALEPRS